MITMRSSDQRHKTHNPHQKSWLTFDPRERKDPLANGFDLLEIFNEHWLSPGAILPPYPHYHSAEILVYVCEGGLAYEDVVGHTGVIRVGEFSLMTVIDGVRYAEMNAIGAHCAHVFEIGIRLNQTAAKPDHHLRQFSVAERRGKLRAVASHDGLNNSLKLNEKITIYSAFLEPGKHLILELFTSQAAWLQLIQGEAVFREHVLNQGDGVGVKTERSLSCTATTATEIILVSFNEPNKSPNKQTHS